MTAKEWEVWSVLTYREAKVNTMIGVSLPRCANL